MGEPSYGLLLYTMALPDFCVAEKALDIDIRRPLGGGRAWSQDRLRFLMRDFERC